MHTLSCHQCGRAFEALRSDAKTCSRACRDAKFRDGKTISRNTSPTQKRREDELFDLHALHCRAYYATPPRDRQAYLEWLIDRAMAGERPIKRMLSSPVLLRSHTGRGGDLQKRYHRNRSWAYPTLPREAHDFTLRTWGVSLLEALSTPPQGAKPSIRARSADTSGSACDVANEDALAA